MTDAGGLPDNVVRLISGGKEGKLTTPGGEQVPVRVFERGDQLVLVLMLEAEDLQRDSNEPFSLEYVSTQGLVRFSGEATLEGRDLVRFTVAAEREVVQRREFVRVDAVQPVVLAIGLGGEAINTHAIDVSGGGMLVTGPDLPLDSSVRFSLHLGANLAPIEGRAHVVRNDEQGRRALVFDDISSADRQRLIHFVFECQRAALAKTKTSGNAAVQQLPSRRANPSQRYRPLPQEPLMSKKDDKAGKDKKGKKGKGAGDGGPSVANHPRARAQIRMAKGWGGLIGFVIAGYMAHKAQVPFAIAGARALAAGVAGYVVAWGCAVTVWRHLVVAELRAAAEAGRVIPQAPAAEQSGS